MRDAELLLPKYGKKPVLRHDGTVITLASDMRWCSDMFEIRCWNAEKVYVAFSLDCCDREAISWVAASQHLSGEDVRDLMAETIESRFGTTKVPKPVEWLSDNGPPYTANGTRSFGAACGLLVKNTPAYSPESNGMAEAFVKTFKRDYAYVNDVSTADAVIKQLPAWFRDYNEHHPHKGLKMLSPRQFRRAHSV
jgi:transposase InsO family protein